MNYRLSINTAPTTEPCTLAEVRARLRLPSTVTTDDTMIENILIPGARATCEAWCRRAFISQKWNLHLDHQPSLIELPLGYVTEVDSVKTLDDDGSTETTESSTTAYHVATGEDARIFLRNGGSWTSTTRAVDVMHIIYTVGWASAAAVPKEIKQAVIDLAAYWYENPEAAESDEIPGTIKRGLQRWKIYKV